MTIEWVAKQSSFNPPFMTSWLQRIRRREAPFQGVNLSHIHTEHDRNSDAEFKEGHSQLHGEIL